VYDRIRTMPQKATVQDYVTVYPDGNSHTHSQAVQCECRYRWTSVQFCRQFDAAAAAADAAADEDYDIDRCFINNICHIVNFLMTLVRRSAKKYNWPK